MSRPWKSAFSEVREVVVSEVSFAATTFSRISFRRSETDSPAARATSAIEVARSKLILTAPSALMSARCSWAIDQTAALSLAVEID